MVYELLRWIVKFSLRIFYRKIEVNGQAHIPAKGPLLVVSNHPNTLMDPLLVAALLRQQAYFMAKSSFFSSSFRIWLLTKLHLIPVHRAQDLKESGKSPEQMKEANQKIFERCISFLSEGGTLLIFPEGSSILEKKLRDIKTGTARIALGALEQDLPEISILPIGLNYAQGNQFRSDVIINVGVPIRLSELPEAYKITPTETVQQLTESIKTSIEQLLIINQSREEETLQEQIKLLYTESLLKKLELPQTDRKAKFEVDQAIAQSITFFTKHDPVRVRNLHIQLQNYLQALKRLGLHDKQFANSKPINAHFTNSAAEVILAIIGLPVFLFGLLHNYVPYKIPGRAAAALTEEQEFEAPIMLATGMFTFPVWYALCFFGLRALLDANIWLWMLYLICLPLTGFFVLYYYSRVISLKGRLNLLSLFFSRKHLITRLRQERGRIISLLETAREDYIKQRQS